MDDDDKLTSISVDDLPRLVVRLLLEVACLRLVLIKAGLLPEMSGDGD